VEKAAFVAMLDDVHEALLTPKNDDNSYTFGRIGDHNIVVACLPAGMTGNNSAATVAKDMLRSFPIKIGLMVGVGGGVWSKKVDVRLGDVVVSQPEGIHGGVVQWDFERWKVEALTEQVH
jgi:nucleoside phosphorylase